MVLCSVCRIAAFRNTLQMHYFLPACFSNYGKLVEKASCACASLSLWCPLHIDIARVLLSVAKQKSPAPPPRRYDAIEFLDTYEDEDEDRAVEAFELAVNAAMQADAGSNKAGTHKMASRFENSRFETHHPLLIQGVQGTKKQGRRSLLYLHLLFTVA